jgi:hypothetical protein
MEMNSRPEMGSRLEVDSSPKRLRIESMLGMESG